MTLPECLADTGTNGVLPSIIVAALLATGGIATLLLLRRRGAKAAGAAMFGLLLAIAISGALVAPSPASAADCPAPASTQPPETVAPTPPPAVAPASLGDYVWNDANRNGIQDAGELPVAGAQLTLLDAATLEPVTVGAGGAPVDPVQVSDATGHYLFTGLAAGSYVVRIATAAVPAEEVSFILQNTTADPLTLRIFDAGMNVVRELPVSSFCGATGDSFFFGSGHTVAVFDVADNDVSASLGSTFTWGIAPAVAALSAALQGTDPSIDSDFDPATSQTAPVVLVAGQTDLTIDAGISLPGGGGSGNCN